MAAAPALSGGCKRTTALADTADAIDTKLDLAKAYMEMGDEEGARNLLKEIVNEGNDDQVEAAKKLMDDM